MRKLELPLLLESTADLVDAVLQDERGELQLNALRMVYATAVSRYVPFVYASFTVYTHA